MDELCSIVALIVVAEGFTEHGPISSFHLPSTPTDNLLPLDTIRKQTDYISQISSGSLVPISIDIILANVKVLKVTDVVPLLIELSVSGANTSHVEDLDQTAVGSEGPDADTVW